MVQACLTLLEYKARGITATGQVKQAASSSNTTARIIGVGCWGYRGGACLQIEVHLLEGDENLVGSFRKPPRGFLILLFGQPHGVRGVFGRLGLVPMQSIHTEARHRLRPRPACMRLHQKWRWSLLPQRSRQPDTEHMICFALCGSHQRWSRSRGCSQIRSRPAGVLTRAAPRPTLNEKSGAEVIKMTIQ